MNKKEVKKKFYKVSIGPLLIECLNKQKENVKKEGYGVLNISFYDSGEMLARKILNHNLV